MNFFSFRTNNNDNSHIKTSKSNSSHELMQGNYYDRTRYEMNHPSSSNHQSEPVQIDISVEDYKKVKNFFIEIFLISLILYNIKNQIHTHESRTYIVSWENKNESIVILCPCRPFFFNIDALIGVCACVYTYIDIHIYVTAGCMLLRHRTTNNNDVFLSFLRFFSFLSYT